jgi:hypothetical protein
MASTHEEYIKLSLILCSRNDRYAGDSVGRLTTALNHAGEVLAAHGRLAQSEVIVSDWGSERPLSSVLCLDGPAREITRFNHIPLEVTSAFPTVFSEVHALNSAARRASGDFIGRIDQDILIGNRFTRWFFEDSPSDRCAYFSCRRDLVQNQPLETYQDAPLWHEHLRKRGWYLNWFWRSAVGIFLMPREIWWDLGGYNEQNIQRGAMEHEFYFRLKRVVDVIDLGPLVDYDFYHLWHDLHEQKARDRNPYLRLPALRKLAENLRPNGEDWGLHDVLPAQQSSTD